MGAPMPNECPFVCPLCDERVPAGGMIADIVQPGRSEDEAYRETVCHDCAEADHRFRWAKNHREHRCDPSCPCRGADGLSSSERATRQPSLEWPLRRSLEALS